MPVTIPGFDYRRIPLPTGVTLNVASAGQGAAVVLRFTASRRPTWPGGTSPLTWRLTTS